MDYENHRAMLLPMFVMSNSLSEYWVKGIVRNMVAILTGGGFSGCALTLAILLCYSPLYRKRVNSKTRKHGQEGGQV